MSQTFRLMLLTWNVAGIFLVLVVRRHRLRLDAGFIW